MGSLTHITGRLCDNVIDNRLTHITQTVRTWDGEFHTHLTEIVWVWKGSLTHITERQSTWMGEFDTQRLWIEIGRLTRITESLCACVGVGGVVVGVGGGVTHLTERGAVAVVGNVTPMRENLVEKIFKIYAGWPTSGRNFGGAILCLVQSIQASCLWHPCFIGPGVD